MAGFIEELFFGNIDPQTRGISKDSAAQRSMQRLAESEALLNERLEGEDKQLFLKNTNAWGEVNGASILDSFITGFRLGAAMAVDTFANDDAPFEDYLKGKG